MHLLIGLDDSYESLVTNILTRLKKEQLIETRLEMSKGKLHNEILDDLSATFLKRDRILLKLVMKIRKILILEMLMDMMVIIILLLHHNLYTLLPRRWSCSTLEHCLIIT